ncbi:trehalose 6-phosphate phosphatase [Bowdeniella nasicola]|uniref:Trehalose 6-phosphate phosphatase n=1 Tax=Bowdeniella nasicola TaxID=208480 RepID=A0A1H3ZGI1_9ACTO|nr:trehalose-phosphatase [Bowdeniella nasicola]SEA22889.1 trehalose 6-phosphate phosphatase [Bowdeniella nasicola]
MTEPGTSPEAAELPADLTAALARAARASRLLLALDFDGSLAPLVPVPEDARMLPAAVPLLARLAAKPSIDLVLVSGRAGDSLAHCAEAPDGTRVVGSHGAQWGAIRVSPSGERSFEAAALELTDEEADLLERVTSAAEEIVARHPGASVEYKPAATVVHTRRATPEVAAAAEAATLAGPGQFAGVNVLAGKAVIELSVLHTTKGEALTRLIETTGATHAIYAGDDVTDEFAFQALASAPIKATTIKVGDGETSATFRVADPHALVAALAILAEADIS